MTRCAFFASPGCCVGHALVGVKRMSTLWFPVAVRSGGVSLPRMGPGSIVFLAGCGQGDWGATFTNFYSLFKLYICTLRVWIV